MTSLLSKKQICTEVGYMFSNIEFMIGMVVLIVAVGFIFNTFFNFFRRGRKIQTP